MNSWELNFFMLKVGKKGAYRGVKEFIKLQTRLTFRSTINKAYMGS